MSDRPGRVPDPGREEPHAAGSKPISAIVAALWGLVLWTGLAVAAWPVRGSINFMDRDDGAITLASARNLVRFGSVSVGRFGDRVYAFSAPLHFLISLPYFGFGGTSYTAFDRGFGFVTFAAVGAMSGALLASELRPRRTISLLIALGAVALLQLSSWTFFGWHFSGMENPLTTCFVLGVVLLAPRVGQSVRAALAAGVLLGLLAVARFDTVTLAVPLLVILLYQLRAWRGGALVRRVIALVLPGVVVGATVLVSTYLYFGTIVPTTAENRGRSATDLLGLTVAAGLIVVAAVAALRGLGRGLTGTRNGTRARFAGLGLVGLGAAGVVLAVAVALDVGGAAAIRRTVIVTYVTGAVWTGVLVVIAWAAPRVRPTRLLVFTTVLLWVPLYELVLGPTRITLARVVSSAVPVLSIAAVVIVAKVIAWRHEAARPLIAWRPDALAPAAGARRRPPLVRWTTVACALACLLVPLALAVDVVRASETSYARTYYLGWVIEPRARILLRVARSTVGPRIVPIVANADLGKLAYAGQAHVVDLGLIGDPLLLDITKVSDPSRRDRLIRLYLFTVLPPDTWMLNGTWACTAKPVVRDPRFGQRYTKVDVGSGSYPADGDLRAKSNCDGTQVQNGVWTLRNPKSRADLALAANLISGHRRPDRAFFDPCRARDVEGCLARMRAYRRAFPGPDGARRAEPLLAGLGGTAAGRLVSALVRSPNHGGWSHDAFAALQDLERISR